MISESEFILLIWDAAVFVAKCINPISICAAFIAGLFVRDILSN